MSDERDEGPPPAGLAGDFMQPGAEIEASDRPDPAVFSRQLVLWLAALTPFAMVFGCFISRLLHALLLDLEISGYASGFEVPSLTAGIGLFVGLVQISVVRDTLTAPQRFLYTPRWIVWVLVTAAMFPASIWLWSALLHLLLGPPNLWDFPEQTSLARILLCGLGSGALVGAVQWPLIRPYGISARKWLAGSTVGWMLGMLVWGGLVSFMVSVDRQFR